MKVGFIGLGRMGAAMALNLLKVGYDVVVHDVRRECAEPHLAAGATWADSVAELGGLVDVVFTSLPGPKEMRSIGLDAGGLLSSMRPGSVWFDLSTNAPAVVREVYTHFHAKGIALFDAPVSGGPSGARSGKLAIYVGGDQEAFEVYKNLLQAIGDQVMYVGLIGAGNSAKLVHNTASNVIRMAIAEVFTLGVKAGVEPLALWHAIRQGGIGRSRTFDRIGDQYLQDKYEPPSFTLNLAHKDMTLALDLAQQLGVPMKHAQATFDDYTAAIERGWGELDARAPMQLQNERAGVSIKVSADGVKQTLAMD